MRPKRYTGLTFIRNDKRKKCISIEYRETLFNLTISNDQPCLRYLKFYFLINGQHHNLKMNITNDVVTNNGCSYGKNDTESTEM